MKRKVIISVVFAFIACSLNALSVDEAVEMAKKNNVSVARGKITLDAVARAKAHSWNSVSPSASVSASSSIPVDSLSDTESKYTASYGVSASVSVSLSGNLFTSMNAAKIAYESGKLTFDDAVKSVELSVREAFYGLLYEKENIVLQEKNLEIAKTQYNNNLAKYNQGRLSEIDVLSAEVNYKSKIPTVESARTTFLNDLASFKQTLGLSLDEEVELDGSLDDLINLNEITVDEKNVQSSSIKQLEYKIASAKNSVMDKRFSAFSPSLKASLDWSDRSWYVGYDGTAPDAQKSASISLSATIPLDGVLPWSARNDAIDTAKDTLKDLELQLENEKKNLTRTVMSSLRSIKQSQESIKYKQANVKLAQKTYDMTAEAYNRGAKDLLTLQNANTSLLNAQVSLKSETLTLIKAILNLENTIGIPFGTLGVNK
ncbi:MAG: TolC family protein [Treponema sp.]|uniref:TolC family protein n=1 Tax=Treponema sp. TaxID=166 RepID=UPI0025E38850|nr:TolC family protein [Treponema sp.]MBR0494601.1 TolC family protein [Treponema sp.]